MDVRVMDKLKNLMEKAGIPDEHAAPLSILVKEVFMMGQKDGMKTYAWWKDGVQFVGTTGKTLAQAFQLLEDEYDGQSVKGYKKQREILVGQHNYDKEKPCNPTSTSKRPRTATRRTTSMKRES